MHRNNENVTLCLCHACHDQFSQIPDAYLKRIDRDQIIMERCTYCDSRFGYDYLLVNKKQCNIN